MKKNIIIFIVLLFLLSGCTSPVKKDLIKYINNDIVKALEIEKEGVAEYKKLVAVDSYSFDELLNAMKK